MEIKKKIFQELDAKTDADTIWATNTSALSISAIAGATRDPERVIGIHYFNPVHRMPLVEVVVGEKTAPDVIQRTLCFVQKTGKLPVVVKDSPGFLVNRILMPYLIEAGLLYESGVPAAEIDEAMLTFGMPMGPLRLIDEVGVDVAEDVASFLVSAFKERLPETGLLRKMIDAGFLGRKAGQGFYVYKGKKKNPEVNKATRDWVVQGEEPALFSRDAQKRMVLLMVNEATRCLEQELVESPDDIDFAMIMGTGFAPFRGGPLHYADGFGIFEIVDDLTALAERLGPRFSPCALLQTMATERKSFFY